MGKDVPKAGQAGLCPWAAQWPLTWPRTGRCARSCGRGPCRRGTAAGRVHTRHRPGGRRARRQCPRCGPGRLCRSAPPAGTAAALPHPRPLGFENPEVPRGLGSPLPRRTPCLPQTSATCPGPKEEGPLPQEAGELALPPGGPHPHLTPWHPLTGPLFWAWAARDPCGQEL